MYNNTVLNLFNNPKNSGRISKPDGIADLYNSDNTAHVEFSLRIEAGIITECRFRAQANPYIVAICSTMTTMLKGKMVSMLFLDSYSIKNELGDESLIDIDFCIECVKMAVLDYKEKLEKENKASKKDSKSSEEIENVSEETVIDDVVEETNPQEFVAQKTSSEPDDDDDFDFSDFFEDI